MELSAAIATAAGIWFAADTLIWIIFSGLLREWKDDCRIMRALIDAKACVLLRELGSTSEEFSKLIDKGLKLWEEPISEPKYEARFIERKETTQKLNDNIEKFGGRIGKVTDLTLSPGDGENALKTLRKRLMIAAPIVIVAIAVIIIVTIEYFGEKNLASALFSFVYFGSWPLYLLLNRPLRRYFRAAKVINELRGS